MRPTFLPLLPLLLVPGCGQDICSAVSEHVASCLGIEAAKSGFECDAGRHQSLLERSCDDLRGASADGKFDRNSRLLEALLNKLAKTAVDTHDAVRRGTRSSPGGFGDYCDHALPCLSGFTCHKPAETPYKGFCTRLHCSNRKSGEDPCPGAPAGTKAYCVEPPASATSYPSFCAFTCSASAEDPGQACPADLVCRPTIQTPVGERPAMCIPKTK